MEPAHCSFVHVWPFRIVGCDQTVNAFYQLLSRDETKRAARFRFEALRRSFVLVRGALRLLLGSYLHESPCSLEFTYGPNGKPAIRGSSQLHFNVSHTSDLAIVGCSWNREIGIDIERMRSIPNIESIASLYFSEAEVLVLQSLPPHQQQSAFFSCWTRKEAYVKATGCGLQTSLNSFAVSVRPEESARLLHIEGDENAAKSWTICDLGIQPGYAAAMAYNGLDLTPILHPIIDADNWDRANLV